MIVPVVFEENIERNGLKQNKSLRTKSEVCHLNWWDVNRSAKSPGGGVLSEGRVLSPPVLRGPVLQQMIIPPASQHIRVMSSHLSWLSLTTLTAS